MQPYYVTPLELQFIRAADRERANQARDLQNQFLELMARMLPEQPLGLRPDGKIKFGDPIDGELVHYFPIALVNKGDTGR